MRGIGAQTVAAPRVSAPVRRDVAAVRGRGRFGDTQLAHLSPKSDAFLKKMGGSGTRNPDTGLKEHFSFKDLLPILAPVALNILAPGIGSSIGESIGLSGAAANLVGSGLTGAGIGALTGGGRGALMGGLTGAGLAGFNEMGGFKGIGESLGIGGGAAPGAVGEAAQPDARGLDMLQTEIRPSVQDYPEGMAPPSALPRPGLAAIAGPAGIESAPLPPPPPSASTQGAAGVPAGTTADKLSGTGLGKAALLGGAMLLLGGAPKPAQGETVEEEIQRLDNSFGGPLPKYELDREMTPLTDEELRKFGQQGTAPKPKGTGIFYDAPNRYKFKNFADGGEVEAARRLQAKGRGGDTILAHINPHEAALLKARGGSGSINPETGLLEFMDNEGQGTSEAGAVGGDYAGGTGDFGYGIDGPTTSTPTGPQSPGGKDEGERAREAAPAAAPGAGPFGDPTGWTHGYTPTTVDLFKDDQRFMGNLNLLGNKAIHGVANMVNNPIATGINVAASLLGLGVPNMLAGALTGWDAGKALTAAGRAIGEAAGKPGATPTGNEYAGTESQVAANGIGQFSRGEGGFYVPGPTAGLGEAPAPTATPGGLNSRFARTLTVPSDAQLRAFGQGGGGRQAGMFYDVPNMQQFADGGEVMDGRSDDVPAMLSHGEHVVDAETVSLLGNGSNDAGHARLEKMKSEIRKRKGKALAKGKISPNAKLPKVA